MSDVIAYLNAHRDHSVAELFELLRIPSISAQSAHAADMVSAAKWLQQRLEGLGLDTEFISTAGHPIVLAQSRMLADKPTLLIYGHYDVQPPDPLDKWLSRPFEPAIRDGRIFARGASDDKGQLMCHLKAVQAYLETFAELPLNIKFLLEGEEECNGHNLADFIQADKSRLACDYVVISDGSQLRPGTPAITYGLRGLVYMEVTVKGPAQDIHSGSFGGAVANPANVLARLIGGLHDADGRVSLDGFYEGVSRIDPQERKALADLGCEDDQLKAQLAVDALPGERGYSSRERMWARPTLDVNGLVSGYVEPGAKTIIPAQASAKISMRLVDQQAPQSIKESFKKYFTERAGLGVCVEFVEHGQAEPVLIKKTSPGIQAARRALEKGFSAPAVFVRSGGTIPVVAVMAQQLTKEILLMGFSLPDDNAHGPNENFRLADYHHGQLSCAYLLAELAGLSR